MLRSQKTPESVNTCSDTAHSDTVAAAALGPVEEFLGIGILLALLLFS